MAESGQVNGNNDSESEGSYLSWQLTSQSVSANTSTIAWQAGWRFHANSCRGLRLGKAVINGTTVYNDTDGGDGVHAYNSGHDHGAKLQTASGSRTITHASNGTKSFSATITMTGWEGHKSDGSSSWSLPAIPRESNAPTKPILTAITATSIHVAFSDGSGGATIDSRQIGYGTNPAEWE